MTAERVAPARFVLTAVHLAAAGARRTLCGRPMDEADLWQPVTITEPACRACALVAERQAGS